MTLNNYQLPVMKTKSTKEADLFKIDTVAMLASQVEALSKKIDDLNMAKQMNSVPKYTKFLKALLTNKRKLDELSTVELNEECSTILQNKLPTKLKDPESFTVTCFIGSLNVKKALADLGASINLMPYKMFKLGPKEPKTTKMSIQLVDKSIKYPKGIIEYVIGKVDKFIFPVNFVILDIDEDIEVPMILGQPFLVTSRTVIDVVNNKLVLKVGDEEVTLQACDFVRVSSEQHDSHYSDNVSSHVTQHSL
ncbi:uncharacterized protein LOC105781643 [Gossypium raimondii]|uniref:uncharacterized protein LOC105781643 n=1 Tax=Gossypium raimondii TaxID=29730 RepID=UPI00063AFB35|nr:uncharacterized protein LOC105781643 [Gossypium raimondii]